MLITHTYINMLSVGEEIIQYFMVRSAECKQAKNGSWYINFNFCDSTGEIGAKLWDQAENAHENYPVGQIVKIQARVEMYNDKLQLQLIRIRNASKEDNVQPHLFVKTAPIPGEDLWLQLEMAVRSITHDTWRAIVEHIVIINKERVMTWPAAQGYHHNYMSGLIYHTCNMLNHAENCCQIYRFLDRDLLISGIILHDIGKISELSAEMGIAEYTTRGKLLGHITEMILWIEKTAILLDITDEEGILKLQHMVAAHHGKLEFGSPVTPKLPEAELLHWLDMLDSRMGAVEDALLHKRGEDEWTDRIKILGTEMYAKSNKVPTLVK